MTRIKINSDGKEIVVPDTVTVTAIAGVLCGLGGLIIGFIIGVICDVVSLYKGDF